MHAYIIEFDSRLQYRQVFLQPTEANEMHKNRSKQKNILRNSSATSNNS